MRGRRAGMKEFVVVLQTPAINVNACFSPNRKTFTRFNTIYLWGFLPRRSLFPIVWDVISHLSLCNGVVGCVCTVSTMCIREHFWRNIINEWVRDPFHWDHFNVPSMIRLQTIYSIHTNPLLFLSLFNFFYLLYLLSTSYAVAAAAAALLVCFFLTTK